jgi:hypothetical protein
MININRYVRNVFGIPTKSCKNPPKRNAVIIIA